MLSFQTLTNGVAIGKTSFAFTSNVSSVIRKCNRRVAKNIKSCFHIPELSPSPHIRRIGDKLAGQVGKTRYRQACAFFRFAVLIIGCGCQGWTPRPAKGVFSQGMTTLQPRTAVPNKNGQNCWAVAVSGQNKGQLSSLESFQLRKPIMEQYDNTEQ